MDRLRTAVLIGVALAIGCGCRYTVGSSLPEGIETVWVPVVANATRVQGAEAEITAAIISEFQTEGSLRPAAKERADCVLRGTVSSYKRDMIRKGVHGAPAVRDIVIRMKLSLEDLRDGKVLFEGLEVSSAQTDPTAGYFRIERGESERLGRERAVRALSKAVVRSVVEHW